MRIPVISLVVIACNIVVIYIIIRQRDFLLHLGYKLLESSTALIILMSIIISFIIALEHNC